MKDLTLANRWNADLIDENYETWLQTPESLSPEWRAFFEGFELGNKRAPSDNHTGGNGESSDHARVIGAIYAYRSIGHTQAKINPLEPIPAKNPRLSLERLGLANVDPNATFATGNYRGGDVLSLKELLGRLEKTYCGSVGCEYQHIQDSDRRKWLQGKMETSQNQPQLNREQEIRVLRKISEAETFERFLHTRYVGQKRFSVEGGETLLAALDTVAEKCPELGIEEIVMGMAHRGRLNVLANFLGKDYGFIFREFSENYIPEMIHGDGDVKYHLGYAGNHTTATGKDVELHLAANPSHLEAVDPIVQGRARARQRLRNDRPRKKVLPVLIHGDAALAGQGIVSEVLNMSQLKGYRTGGTVHFIVNNQIGFTTNPEESRSSRYCTDIAKMIEAPIFHVNGDDPLAVAMITELAVEYRQEFGDDVFIDIYCYRRHGHNESDEPLFTQPLMYKKLSSHPHISETLTKELIAKGDFTENDAQRLKEEYQAVLDAAFKDVKQAEEDAKTRKTKRTAVQPKEACFKPAKTATSKKILNEVTKALTTVPDSFKLNPKIQRQMKAKAQAYAAGEGIDWGFAEGLAFGSLMLEGNPVRLSGQDCERGTFSHRHAVVYDIETREQHVLLNRMRDGQEILCVHNSSLSEAAILGFDLGYTIDYPEMLGIWEAQFGDFANGAQVIIDQFLVSGESKWQQKSGLVLLLPHGYEGQGPEHSSARMERFLQSSAEENIQVCNVTTPAQYFHVLRRQLRRDFQKPLVIMSPKSMLRHKGCVSAVKEFTQGSFEEILDDPAAPKKAERIILCSGKLYYDLIVQREALGASDAVILRVEQVYPLHKERLKELFKKYGNCKKIVWCQEEPKNMGAWSFIAPEFDEVTGVKPVYAGRKLSASPAVGSLSRHKVEQKALLEEAFTL